MTNPAPPQPAVVVTNSALPQPAAVVTNSAPPRPAPVPFASAELDEPEDDPAVTPVARLAPAPSADRWRQAVDSVRAQSARHGKSLAFGRIVSVKPGEVTVYYPPEQAFHRTTVTAQSGKAIIEKALSEYYQRPTKLLLSDTAPAGTPSTSVAEDEAKDRAAREKSAEGQMRNHPAVRAVLRVLGGEIEHVRVIEKERPPASPLENPDDGA